MRPSISILAAVLALAVADQAVVDDLATNLNAMYQVVDGFPAKPDCGVDADSGLCFSSAVHLKYSGAANQTDMSWELYVPFPHRILRIDSPDFTVEHITGAWLSRKYNIARVLACLAYFMAHAPSVSTWLRWRCDHQTPIPNLGTASLHGLLEQAICTRSLPPARSRALGRARRSLSP